MMNYEYILGRGLDQCVVNDWSALSGDGWHQQNSGVHIDDELIYSLNIDVLVFN
jgi:hypothetical protein